ncbi:arsenate reductase family protein [Sulfurimonas sp.]|nr:arsenate reductase family protein [Sulfurimonas sp.]
MIQVYGIKNCDSVKKAIKFFKDNDLEYTLHDFKTQELDCSKLTSWLLHVDMKKLFNSRSTTYKNLNLKELNPNDDEKKEWLCKENLLIKRPVIEYNDKVIVGYNEDEYKKELI